MPRQFRVERTTLSTRKKALRLIEEVEDSGYAAIDLSQVEFVSRSFADELSNEAEKRGIKLYNMEGIVAKMFEKVGAESGLVA